MLVWLVPLAIWSQIELIPLDGLTPTGKIIEPITDGATPTNVFKYQQC